jgi:hypothetical protein
MGIGHKQVCQHKVGADWVSRSVQSTAETVCAGHGLCHQVVNMVYQPLDIACPFLRGMHLQQQQWQPGWDLTVPYQ